MGEIERKERERRKRGSIVRMCERQSKNIKGRRESDR